MAVAERPNHPKPARRFAILTARPVSAYQHAATMRADEPPFQMTPQEMIAKMLEPGFAGDGELANDLLSEFGKGFPLENLRLLLDSPNEHVTATAAFLMTFYGFKLRRFLPEITRLLDCKYPYTRGDTIEVLRECTTPQDGKVLGRVLMHLDDENPGVRWKVVQFICTVDPWQLNAGLRNAARMRPDSVFAILDRVYRRDRTTTAEDIRWLIGHSDPVARRFGAALAARPIYVVDERLLDIAALSDDAEIVRLAKDGREGGLPPCYSISSSALLDRSQTRP
jgi:hypothetical protein